MHFLKYLLFIILSSLSASVFAVMYEYNVAGVTWYSSAESACKNWKHSASQFDDNYTKVNGEICEVRLKSNNSLYNKAPIKKREVACPTGDSRNFLWWQDRAAPASVCLSKCEYLKPPGPLKCVSVDHESEVNEELCGDYISSGKTCTEPDPNPSTQPKPPECKNSNGSDSYCNKPPEGCPTGYKQAMFNNQQICVKDSPNDPNPNDPNNNNPPDPDPNQNPNACTATYCPKPDDEKSCPDGYYTSIYNNSKICVKNNPNDPTNPNNPNNNPNDPNNTGDGDGNGGNTPIGGEFCEGSGKPICDAFTKLKDYLTDEPKSTDLTNTALEIKEEKIDQFKREDHVRFGQYCPFQVTTEQVGFITVEKDLTWMCTFGHEANPYIKAIGYLGALIYILIAMRSKS